MKKIITAILVGMFILSLAPNAYAQGEDKFALSITPPLIKINMAPGETWTSSIRVVNNNPTATSIYAQKVDFKSGEDGGVVFIQKKSDSDHFLLSAWLTIPDGPISLKPFESKEVPFTISVPEKAEAGGHYAAILTGTKPPEDAKIEGSGIKISSMIASLIMLNVKGDIKEEGDIREFVTEKEVYTDAKVKFRLTFENSGNVHLQPQGGIVIYDMFGREKGRIDINQKSDFGNVLPQSNRKWLFDWEGEKGFFASGRYRAELTLTYGEQARQNVSRIAYFWIIDVKSVGIVFGGIFAIIVLLLLFIRFYVRKAVKSVQQQMGAVAAETRKAAGQIPNVRKITPAKKESTVNLKK